MKHKINYRGKEKSFNNIPSRSSILKTVSSVFLVGILVFSFHSCKSKPELLTKRLFMQSKRVHLDIPENKEDASGNIILSEQVNYINEDNTSITIQKRDSASRAKTSLNEVQRLDEVVITAKVKQKFTPERDGRVNIDFIVRVPKELLSPDWRITLSPKLFHNDSIVPLKELTLKGSNFANKQKTDYESFAEYESSIIPESAYDSLFLDHDAVSRDLRKRQEFYWDLYSDQYQDVKGYYDWKHDITDSYAKANSRATGKRLNLYHKYMRKSDEEAIRLLASDIDTTGINSKYTKKFNKRVKLFSRFYRTKDLTLKKVPKKYKDYFLNEPSFDNIDGHSTTDKDSIGIAKHRYHFDKIAENEFKNKRRGEMRERMIPFASENGMLLDTIVDGGKDFIYYYKKEYPVTAGLSRLRITINGKVMATDKSTYSLSQSDTLNYMISSLAQLADTSLTVRKTKLYRNMYDKISIYPEFESGKNQFNLSYKDNIQQVDTLMKRYRKLTTEMGLRMDSVEIYSRGSLDGDYDNNYKLSEKRAEAFKAYLEKYYQTEVQNTTIKVIPRGEDWQGLVDELKKRDDIINRDSILAKIERTVYPDETEKEIRKLYANDYKIIQNEIYPKLRRMDISFNVSRPDMLVADSVKQEVKEGYEEGLRLLQNREYWQALDILKNYPDYNLALCLACMGYNGKAYDLLIQLKPTGDIEYLLSIVTQRMGKEEEAIKHLIKSIELDNRKAYRWKLDSEVIALVHKYNLQSRISAIANNLDFPEYDEQNQTTETKLIEEG